MALLSAVLSRKFDRIGEKQKQDTKNMDTTTNFISSFTDFMHTHCYDQPECDVIRFFSSLAVAILGSVATEAAHHIGPIYR